jgi:hypothetical protein
VSFQDKTIHAETGESFKAVLGKIHNLPKLTGGETLHGTIKWGDGSATSAATFITESDGTIDVIGSHTYAKHGTDKITVILTHTPPTGSNMGSIAVGQIKSTADVITKTNGVTLNEIAKVPFTADLGSILFGGGDTVRATIAWGDGTTSTAKLLPEPTAFPNGGYEVQGKHTYAETRSYLVTVTAIITPPPPTPGHPSPMFVAIEHFDSVIDVLPGAPTPVV